MKSNKDLLSSILKTTQMGQIGIRSILNLPVQENMRNALQSQLNEYDAIERDAHEIACARGWAVDELNPAIKLMTNLMTASYLKLRNTNSRTASMMIKGNMRGVIKGIRNIHQYLGNDEIITALSHKLITCEQFNIKQMQEFL